MSPRVHLLALGLLGRHVGHRAQYRPFFGVRRLFSLQGFGRGFIGGHRLGQLRQAEIEHLDQAVPGDHDIGGF